MVFLIHGHIYMYMNIYKCVNLIAQEEFLIFLIK